MSNKRKSNNTIDRKHKRHKCSHHKPINIPEIREECLICMDKKPVSEIINIHHDHFKMCKDCLGAQGKALLNNIDLLPWKCSVCTETLSVNILNGFMENYNKLLDRVTNMLTQNCVSCPNCDNSFVLDSDQKDRSYIFCSICHHKIVIKSDDELKKEDENLELAQILAETNGWKPCPVCGEVIEKTEGCNQMTHRETDGSYTYFCYQCGEQLDGNNIDSQGNDHFPNGSYNDCVNCTNHSNIFGGLEDLDVSNLGPIDYNINFSNFNWIPQNNQEYVDDYDYDQHFNGNDYQCPMCNYNSPNDYSLRQHMEATDHYLDDLYDFEELYNSYYDNYQCPTCNNTYNSSNSIRQHMLAKGHF
jgi:hypothetical protein